MGEPHDLGQGDRAVVVGEVAQHPAGADRGQLVVVTDQAHRPAAGR